MYTTYEYYSTTYGGTLPEPLFTTLATRADIHLENLTHGNVQYAPDTMTDRVQLAECEMVDALAELDGNTATGKAGLISSESNDGFSVSYNVQAGGKDMEGTVLRTICKKYLTHPYNIMYGGGPR